MTLDHDAFLTAYDRVRTLTSDNYPPRIVRSAMNDLYAIVAPHSRGLPFDQEIARLEGTLEHQWAWCWKKRPTDVDAEPMSDKFAHNEQVWRTNLHRYERVCDFQEMML